MKTCWLFVVAALAVGCTPDFIPQWEVKKPRLMVAKLSIDGDTEGRSRPGPGESFSIRYFMMSPEKPQDAYDADVATCIGAVLPDGTLACFDQTELQQAAEDLGVDIDLDFGKDLEVEPYQGDDQLLVHGFKVPPLLDAPPELIEGLPPPFNSLDRVGTFGTLCVDGRVERLPGMSVADDPISELFRCVDNDDASYKTPLPFTMSVYLDLGQPGGTNHHPSFACDDAEPSGPCHEGVELDGERVAGPIVLERPKKLVDEEGGDRVLSWPAWDKSEPLPWEGCADAPDSLPKVRARSGQHTVRVRFDASDREQYERVIEENGRIVVEPRREELILSHAITTRGGSLRGYASALTRETPDSEAEIDITYTPPEARKSGEQIDESGRLVRFYFALRDQRGGTDFTTRELCLLPPED